MLLLALVCQAPAYVGAHEGGGTALALSSDGALAATSGADGRIAVWDTAGAKRRASWSADAAVLAFSPDGTRLASARDGRLTLWESSSGKLLREWELPQGPPLLAYGPWIAGTGTGATSVALWDVDSGKELRRLEVAEGAGGLAFSPKEALLAVATSSGLRLVDAKTGELRRALKDHSWMGFQAAPRAGPVVFSPDGSKVAGAAHVAGPAAAIWAVADGTPVYQCRPLISAAPRFAFSADGSLFHSGTDQGALKTWRVDPPGRETQNVRRHAKAIVGLAVAGPVTATLDVDGNLSLAPR